MYYACDQTGISAYRSIVLLHDEMQKCSLKLPVKYCVSAGSPLDDNNVFAKVLEKNGWSRKGYMAVTGGGPKTAPAGTQVQRPWRAFAK